jgi:hypothetical protein
LAIRLLFPPYPPCKLWYITEGQLLSSGGAGSAREHGRIVAVQATIAFAAEQWQAGLDLLHPLLEEQLAGGGNGTTSTNDSESGGSGAGEGGGGGFGGGDGSGVGKEMPTLMYGEFLLCQALALEKINKPADALLCMRMCCKVLVFGVCWTVVCVRGCATSAFSVWTQFTV